ncbi:MAG: hypothetical protein PHG92_01980, partial [Patescibacteria group bacterium]|nr:hypothetical protein [Patescibacteria group bacterium]
MHLKFKKIKSIKWIIVISIVSIFLIIIFLIFNLQKEKSQNFQEITQKSFKYLNNSGIRPKWQMDNKKIEYKEFLNDAYDYHDDIQDWFFNKKDLKDINSWHFDQNIQKIIWLNKEDTAILEADAQIIGTLGYSRRTGIATWNWSWNSKDTEPELTTKIVEVKDFGEIYDYDIREANDGINILTENYWEANENDAITIAAISQYIVGGIGVYP